ncbi:apolipoprotein N-acyltransferase [Nitratireductor sp. ZSWI3]|uniref:apolipoprotein N-acyltransferase n=1 Tax=Nitratireductor sp. ZSWI3 TaxID=2966359 RepID=UPI0021506AF3|nr:apolipoprotein N-acyltransferase [Nitratireductor sp. ZSWI3]MCR4268737.1 apolipoprotein N-acyltransferase [Nitratireductor sp. ZSWI3]
MEDLAGRVILLSGWRRALLGFSAGIGAALAQPPFDFFAACFVAFPVLVWLLDGADGEGRGFLARHWPAFATGWWFGFGYFLFGLWWIGNALLVDAENFAWALPFAAIGLPAFLAIFYGFASFLARLFWSDGVLRLLALAFGFGLAEWLRANILTGFPWNAIGYSAMPTVLSMQSANIFGLDGMNTLAVLVFSTPALIGTRRGLAVGTGIAAVCIGLHLGYGYLRLSQIPEVGKTMSVRIVQPSILQDEKWDVAEQNRIFRLLVDLSSAPVSQGETPPDLIVWPETAVPFFFSDRPDALAELGRLLADGQMLLAGAVRVEGGEAGTERYYNSVIAVGPDGAIVDAVDKVHLVPFGEYVPFAEALGRLGLGRIVQSVGPFSKGASRHAISLANGVRVLPFVCYEIIFPGIVDGASERADLLLNLTNDAWFGLTPGPYQHFRQAQVRAVETGLPLVRAANNGISAVVDSYGRVIDAFDLDAVGALDVKVPLGRADKFSFAGAGTNGPFVALSFGLVALIGRIAPRRRLN